jgi:U3 small nucleolar RNA-associated protein 19
MILFRHLPVNLIASFAKRLARLALLIPQHDQCLILTFIYNLIIRRPTIRIMIDRSQPIKYIYSSEELDSNNTNAIDSFSFNV